MIYYSLALLIEVAVSPFAGFIRELPDSGGDHDGKYDERLVRDKVLILALDIASVAVTIISIIVTVINICISLHKDKHQK